MIDITKFPNAAEVKQIAETRAKDNHERALQNIFEQTIEPAIKEGRFWAEFNPWSTPDSVVEFLKSLDYKIYDKYKDERGTVILAWGDIDIDNIYS